MEEKTEERAEEGAGTERGSHATCELNPGLCARSGADARALLRDRP